MDINTQRYLMAMANAEENRARFSNTLRSNVTASLGITIEFNIHNQMDYLTHMFNVQAMTRDEYIDEMSSLAIILEDLATDVFDYQKKEGEK